MPNPCQKILGLLYKFIDGQKRWLDKNGGRIYTWDSLHGELEVFNMRGRHIAVVDCDGRIIKEAIRGRAINV